MNNEKSLLMYIYEFIDSNDKYRECLDVLNDFTILKKASSIETDVLTKMYNRITDNMKELNEMIKTWKDDYSDDINDGGSMIKGDKFIEHMEQFLKKSNQPLNSLKMSASSTNITTQRFTKFFAFGTEEKPESVENLFKIIFEFLEALQVLYTIRSFFSLVCGSVGLWVCGSGCLCVCVSACLRVCVSA